MSYFIGIPRMTFSVNSRKLRNLDNSINWRSDKYFDNLLICRGSMPASAATKGAKTPPPGSGGAQ
jgi:hypothetical protein